MSDPAKSAREIEDVLASIRRLVSESHVGPAADVTAAQPAPRLVLTPALRVADPDDPWAPVPSSREDVPAARDAAAPEDMAEDEDPTWGLEDRLSDWGEIEDSAEEAVADAIAEQAADPMTTSRPDRRAELDGGAEHGSMTDFPATSQAEFEPETGDADWPDRSAGRALRDLVLVRGHSGEAAKRVGADADADDTLPAFETRSAAVAGTDGSGGPSDFEDAGGSEAPTNMTEDESVQAQADDAASRQGFAPVFSRRIDVRRPAAATDDADDPDQSEDPDTDAHVEDLGEAGQPFSFPETEDGLLDEETLRDLIAEVVREELQGVLGQRITRNVRKMVRREIRLALAAEDLE